MWITRAIQNSFLYFLCNFRRKRHTVVLIVLCRGQTSRHTIWRGKRCDKPNVEPWISLKKEAVNRCTKGWYVENRMMNIGCLESLWSSWASFQGWCRWLLTGREKRAFKSWRKLRKNHLCHFYLSCTCGKLCKTRVKIYVCVIIVSVLIDVMMCEAQG